MRIVCVSMIALGVAGCAAKPPPAPEPAPVPVVQERPKPVLVPSMRAPICSKQAEKAALAVAALRMQLSVTEISCDARDQFNNFTMKFRHDVSAQNELVNQFFRRAYGRSGQSKQDQYETEQINQLSSFGTNYYGSDFCKIAMPMFDAVLALKDDGGLEDFALNQKFDQVMAVDDCVEEPIRSAATSAKSPAKAAAKAP